MFIGCCNDSKNKKVGRMNLLEHCLCNFARGNATRKISVRVYLLLSEAALSVEESFIRYECEDRGKLAKEAARRVR